MSWNYPREDYTRELYTLSKSSRKPWVLCVLIQWTWTSVHAACTHLIDDADLQIVLNVNLARQTHVRREFGFNCKPVALEFAHFLRFAFKYLNPAGGATRISTAAVQDIDTRVFQRQHQFLPGRRVSFN
jgi:hypothetical protein